MTESIEVLVVGAGQSGIAMSEHLRRANIPHLVLERERVAERWRSRRWDSLVANGPAWHDRLPGRHFDANPDEFVPKEAVADYLVDYASHIEMPVRAGVEVMKVTRRTAAPGFFVETSEGPLHARFLVAATGAYQRPIVPDIIPASAPVRQLHSADYRNPSQLSDGGVLVVGGGASGAQIATELHEAGRDVTLSIGAHERPPRRYRQRDYVWWLGALGLWDLVAPPSGAAHVPFAVTGARGGYTVDFRTLAASGMTITGRTMEYVDGVVRFGNDVAENIIAAEKKYLALLEQADAYVERNGIDLPPEPEAHNFLPMPRSITDPLQEIDLVRAGITSVIWATGYREDFSWLPAGAVDDAGRARQLRGAATNEPGIYFLGLPWLTRRASSFIYGVSEDAGHVTDLIKTQRYYDTYQGCAERIFWEEDVVGAPSRKSSSTSMRDVSEVDA